MEIRIFDRYELEARRLRSRFVGRLLLVAVGAIDLAVRRVAHRIAVGLGR